MMCVTWNKIIIGCAYLITPSSPFENRNAKKIEEIQEHLFAKNRCMLLIDANAWIGEIPSEVAHTENGSEKETKRYERKSENKEFNKKGEDFVEHMNNIDMIILNGIKSTAQYTHDHPGREATSIVDCIKYK